MSVSWVTAVCPRLTRVSRNTNRQAEIQALTSKGIIPHEEEMRKHPEKHAKAITFLTGQVAGLINDVLPAKVIIENMVNDAAQLLQQGAAKVTLKAKL